MQLFRVFSLWKYQVLLFFLSNIDGFVSFLDLFFIYFSQNIDCSLIFWEIFSLFSFFCQITTSFVFKFRLSLIFFLLKYRIFLIFLSKVHITCDFFGEILTVSWFFFQNIDFRLFDHCLLCSQYINCVWSLPG